MNNEKSGFEPIKREKYSRFKTIREIQELYDERYNEFGNRLINEELKDRYRIEQSKSNRNFLSMVSLLAIVIFLILAFMFLIGTLLAKP